MINRAYSIYDCKGYIWNPPFYAVSDGAALRLVKDIANDLQTSVGRHPSDYSVWFVGEFNDQDGHFVAHRPATHVCDCVALVDHQPSLVTEKQ